MRDRYARYKLKHIIEMDDSYFGSSAAGKRGRGAANKSTVVIAVETSETAPGYAAMEVVDSMHSPHLRDFAFRHIEDDQTVKTDKYPFLIGNVKSFIRGTYHGVSHKHLQPYLSEFCYRFLIVASMNSRLPIDY